MNNRKDLISKDNKLKIQIIDSDEPNNGRMLWSVKVELNGTDISSKLFENNWNYINFETSNLELLDEKCDFYYIPVESIAKLIRKADKKIINLKYQGASTARFLGNKFSKNYLIEIFNDEISITNLNNFKNTNFKPDEDIRICHSEFIDEENIRIDMYKTENEIRKVHSTTLNIKNEPLVG